MLENDAGPVQLHAVDPAAATERLSAVVEGDDTHNGPLLLTTGSGDDNTVMLPVPETVPEQPLSSTTDIRLITSAPALSPAVLMFHTGE